MVNFQIEGEEKGNNLRKITIKTIGYGPPKIQNFYYIPYRGNLLNIWYIKKRR